MKTLIKAPIAHLLIHGLWPHPLQESTLWCSSGRWKWEDYRNCSVLCCVWHLCSV